MVCMLAAAPELCHAALIRGPACRFGCAASASVRPLHLCALTHLQWHEHLAQVWHGADEGAGVTVTH